MKKPIVTRDKETKTYKVSAQFTSQEAPSAIEDLVDQLKKVFDCDPVINRNLEQFSKQVDDALNIPGFEDVGVVETTYRHGRLLVVVSINSRDALMHAERAVYRHLAANIDIDMDSTNFCIDSILRDGDV